MKAMILVAGYGTRLGELTKDIPKPMLDVGRRPILEHIILNLARQGIRQIAVNLHHKGDAIKEYFGSGKFFGVELVYSREPKLLGTAGAIKKMEWFLGTDTFLVHYGDILTDQDFGPMIQFHHEKGAMATLLVRKYRHAHSAIEMDMVGRVTTFLERPTAEERARVEFPWDNSCIHVCEPGFLAAIPPNVTCDLAGDIFPNIVSGGRLYAFIAAAGRYCAIDSPEQLNEARKQEEVII